MATLCFLPWATITAPLRFGAFHLVPLDHALMSGALPRESQDAVAALLEGYEHRRPVDRERVPLLRRDDSGLLDDLEEERLVAYFEFRARLAFASLARREFFSTRYWNSDNLRLVVQGFATDRPGGALISTRRRDGETGTFVPRGTRSFPRPLHVPWCELPRDLDAGFLHALEAHQTGDGPTVGRVAEAVRLFVASNTDNSDVGLHSELIDTVGAFSRLADVWDEKGTVGHFGRVLPSSVPGDDPTADVTLSDIDDYPPTGPKAAAPAVMAQRAKGVAMRAIWLRDAYLLRSQVGHGRVHAPPYRAAWDVREHLLLAAVALPLTVKAMLRDEGHYTFTDRDRDLDDVFDALTTITPFTERDEGNEGTTPRWQDVMGWAQRRAFYRTLARDFVARLADRQASAPDTTAPGSLEVTDVDSASADEEGADPAPTNELPTASASPTPTPEPPAASADGGDPSAKDATTA